jgi:hypothetical protein
MQRNLAWHFGCIHGRGLPVTATGWLPRAIRRSFDPGKGSLPSLLPPSPHAPNTCANSDKDARDCHTDSRANLGACRHSGA